jgi:hypothetical protein
MVALGLVVLRERRVPVIAGTLAATVLILAVALQVWR